MLTTKDLQRLFGVTYMTVYNWRRRHGLPCSQELNGRRYTVRFHPDDVRTWAEENDKDYYISVARELGVEA